MSSIKQGNGFTAKYFQYSFAEETFWYCEEFFSAFHKNCNDSILLKISIIKFSSSSFFVKKEGRGLISKLQLHVQFTNNEPFKHFWLFFILKKWLYEVLKKIARILFEKKRRFSQIMATTVFSIFIPLILSLKLTGIEFLPQTMIF